LGTAQRFNRTLAQRYDRALDEWYERCMRSLYECCHADLRRWALQMGLRRFDLSFQLYCRTCGLIWVRDGESWRPA